MGRRRRRAWAAAGAVAIPIAVVAVIAARHGTGSGGASGPVPPVTDSSSHAPADRVTTAEHLGCTTGDEPANFPLYSLGRSFRGLPLTAILRRCDRPYSSKRATPSCARMRCWPTRTPPSSPAQTLPGSLDEIELGLLGRGGPTPRRIARYVRS